MMVRLVPLFFGIIILRCQSDGALTLNQLETLESVFIIEYEIDSFNYQNFSESKVKVLDSYTIIDNKKIPSIDYLWHKEHFAECHDLSNIDGEAYYNEESKYDYSLKKVFFTKESEPQIFFKAFNIRERLIIIQNNKCITGKSLSEFETDISEYNYIKLNFPMDSMYQLSENQILELNFKIDTIYSKAIQAW